MHAITFVVVAMLGTAAINIADRMTRVNLEAGHISGSIWSNGPPGIPFSHRPKVVFPALESAVRTYISRTITAYWIWPCENWVERNCGNKERLLASPRIWLGPKTTSLPQSHNYSLNPDHILFIWTPRLAQVLPYPRRRPGRSQQRSRMLN